ncbi:MAG: hypothetical protein AAFN41_02550 [Planctomycetota bacterium]
MLRNSHVMPAWTFRRIQKLAGRPDNVVTMSEERAILSNDQHREYLLCHDCEGRFNPWEQYVASITWKGRSRFRALDLVEAIPTIDDDVRSASAELDTAAIIRFGVSVFWRASVSSRVPNFHLGPQYEEQARLFLLGEAEFPPKARLVITLLTPPEGVPIDDGGDNAQRATTGCSSPCVLDARVWDELHPRTR